MPRFFFDYFDGEHFDEDQEGLELFDADTAYLEAFKAATDMWGEAVRERRNPTLDCFRIRDQTGVVVLELPFAEVLGRLRRPRPVRVRDYDAQRAYHQVERGRKIVEDQRDRLERVRTSGRDTTEAERTLDTFATVLLTFEDTLNSLQAIRRTTS
jgi:hypothetical protein